MKQYINGFWMWDHATGNIGHLKSGEYNQMEALKEEDFDIIIPRSHVNELVDFLDKNNLIKPKMDNQSRDADLKIVHRLLDVIEKKLPGD